ncbi:conserved protein of unknown function [Nitrospira japonica]|uniref:Uncharacterized protein n=1 Tax=Nitrospira japonica TaxID=1325564 RepID=A0A1W1I3N0_9BACT|nr:hypothetical protein [Nitrospira japonica]SLM47561.1 conserved protein of unknown function [Nitrospira japonica]
MNPQAQALADFRSQVTRLLQERDVEWENSRKLVGAGRLPETLRHLIEEVRRVDLPPSICEAILTALNFGHVERVQDLPGPRLKELTGLPPTKAVRALCVWFDLAGASESPAAASSLPATVLEAAIQDEASPFDVLLAADAPSLLDLGAGDLSFASEVADRYAAPVRAQGKTLVLHGVDRLQPQSKLGGPLHPDRLTLDRLRSRPDLSFQFFPGQDMFALERLDRSGKLVPCYTLVTCWAPATPTFAYEPARLGQDAIITELQRTKGLYHQTDYDGEPALEVRHGERSLLFPPWKFDVRGPLALLDLLSRRGQICVLGAVDDQVFWELLSQVLEGEQYRPPLQPFTPDAIKTVFADIYPQLAQLAIGASMSLADCAPLRRQIPRVLPVHAPHAGHYGFQSIRVRRGAWFSGMPVSSTARKFPDMVEEATPWMLTLIPAR